MFKGAKMFKRMPLLALLIGAIINTSTADAEKPQRLAPLRVFTAREIFNSRLNSLLKQCNITSRKNRDDKNVELVTLLDTKNYDLAKRLREVPDNSAQALFGYIFASAKDATELKLDIDPARQLPMSLRGPNLPIPRSTETNFEYSGSCATALRAALRANIDLSIAQAKGALDAESTSSSETIIIAGTFDSPLYVLLNNQGIEPERKLAAMLTIWQDYVTKKSKFSNLTERRYLSAFRGIVFYEGYRSSSAADASGSASFNLNFFLGSASGEGSASLTRKVSTRINAYSTYIDLVGGVNSEPLPSPTKIVAEFARARPVVEGSQYIREAESYNFSVAVKGIPMSLCGPQWDVKPVNTKIVGLNYLNATLSDSGGIPTCTFHFRITPTAAVIQEVSGGSLDLSFALTSKDSVQLDPQSNGNLTLSVPVRVPLERDIESNVINFPGAPVPIGTENVWTTKIFALDPLARIRNGSSVITSLSTIQNCTKSASDFAVRNSIVYDGRPFDVKIFYKGLPLAATDASKTCTAVVNVQYKLRTGADLIVPFTVQLDMPVQGPTPN